MTPPRNKRLKLTLLVLSSVLALGVAEMILTAFGPPEFGDLPALRAAAAKRAGVAFDERSTLQVLEELRSEGIDTHPPIKPYNFLQSPLTVAGRELLPLAGVAEVVTVFNANETGERFVYLSDEYGFHNPVGVHGVDADLVLLGDSFAQGVAVQSDQNLAALLRKEFPRTVNLGMGASGPLIELAIFREYAEPLTPKTVLWLYYEANDLVDIATERQNEVLLSYLDGSTSQRLREVAGPLNHSLIAYSKKMVTDYKRSLSEAPAERTTWFEHLTLTETRRLLSSLTRSEKLGSLEGESSAASDELQLLVEVVSIAKERTEQWGGRFVFVYLPEFARFSKRWELGLGSAFRDPILAWTESEGIETIDLFPTFLSRPDPEKLFPFALPGHYNPEGYRLAADTIRAALVR